MRRHEKLVAATCILLLELLVLVVLLGNVVAETGLAMARAAYALLLRFSQYMLWCR